MTTFLRYSTCTSPICNGKDEEQPLGPLAFFSFVVQTKVDRSPYRDQQDHLREAMRRYTDHGGITLDTREKGVLFPIIHFTEDLLGTQDKFSGKQISQETLSDNFLLYRGVYREVRSICPESDDLLSFRPDRNMWYIVLGFKSIDRDFSQVMVDSWKDWTGARYIYMYLPDELGLNRIRFFTREAPDNLSMFMYLVVVECRGIDTPEKQMRLLDFAQRMRVERMSGYISVYGISS